MCYKQKCKVVSLNLAHPVYKYNYLFTQLLTVSAAQTLLGPGRGRRQHIHVG